MVQHADLTSIHRGAYVSSEDPGAVGAQKLWVDTSVGPPYVLKVRTAANDNWDDIGGAADGSFSSSVVKPPVWVATNANVTLSGLQNIDGATGGINQRVLVRAQTNPAENGIYTMQSGAWQRAADADASNELVGGTLVYVQAGAVYSDTLWALTTDLVTVGTTGQTWVQANNPMTTVFDLHMMGSAGVSTRLAKGAINTVLLVTPGGVLQYGLLADANIAANAQIALSKLAMDPLARANHTGTQLASTISDFDTQVHAARLDQLALPTANVNMGGFPITNLADPVVAQGAATKAYVDAVANGIDWKASVRAATTPSSGNVTLSGPQTIDGVSAVAGDRVLVKNQSTLAQNGIYAVQAGAWTRSTDADTANDVNAGLAVFVSEGATNADTSWILTTNDPIVLGTTGLTFTQFGGPGSVTAGTGIQVTGNQVALVSPVAIANGGTGAASQAAAKANFGWMTRVSQSIGDGVTTSFNVTHNLATNDIVVEIYEVATGVTVLADVIRTSTNVVQINFAAAPSTGQCRVVVMG